MHEQEKNEKCLPKSRPEERHHNEDCGDWPSTLRPECLGEGTRRDSQDRAPAKTSHEPEETESADVVDEASPNSKDGAKGNTTGVDGISADGF